MKHSFRAKKSVLLGLILWIPLLLQFYNFGLPAIEQVKLVPIFFQFLLFTFIGIIWFGIRYEVDGDQLIVKVGPISSSKTKIQNIQSISRSHNPLSSPAPSLRRIMLRVKNQYPLLLSPKKESHFISKLKEQNPSISNNVPDEQTNAFIRFIYWLL